MLHVVVTCCSSVYVLLSMASERLSYVYYVTYFADLEASYLHSFTYCTHAIQWTMPYVCRRTSCYVSTICASCCDVRRLFWLCHISLIRLCSVLFCVRYVWFIKLLTRLLKSITARTGRIPSHQQVGKVECLSVAVKTQDKHSPVIAEKPLNTLYYLIFN